MVVNVITVRDYGERLAHYMSLDTWVVDMAIYVSNNVVPEMYELLGEKVFFTSTVI